MYAISFFLVIAHACTLQVNFNRDCYSEGKVSITLKEKEASLKGNLLDFRNVTMIIIILYLGIVDGTFHTFMFWYLIDISPSQPTWVMGVVGLSRCSASIVMFGLSGMVIKALGVFNTIHASLIIYMFTFILCGLITNPWLALIPDVMQGVAFAISLPASILFSMEKSSPSLAATMQGKYFVSSTCLV